MKYLTDRSCCLLRRVPELLSFCVPAACLWLLCSPWSRGLAEVPQTTPPDAPGSGLINPGAIAWNSLTEKVYTVDPSHNLVIISNDQMNTTRQVHVGAQPVSLATDSQTGTTYVANSGDGTVSVIDGKSDEVTATVHVGSHPYSIAANSVAGKVYVTHTFNDHLTVIDGKTNEPTNFPMGSSDLIVVDEIDNLIYLLGYEGGSVKVFDGKTNTTNQKSVGMHAWGMALNQSDRTLYIARPGYEQLAVLAPTSQTPILIDTGHIPCAVAINSQTARAYVVDYGDDSVSVVDLKQRRSIATIHVGTHPQAIALDVATNRVFVANTHSNNVSVIDGGTNQVLSTLQAGKNPYALTVNQKTGRLHIANLGSQSSTAIDVPIKR